MHQMNGSKNVFVENFVSDIQDKYNDIKKLEEVKKHFFPLKNSCCF